MKKMIVLIGLLSLLLSACGYFVSEGDQGSNSVFPRVTKPYQPEQAIQNGDVVNVHGQYSNMEKWHQFIKNIETNREDEIRITQYTIEGDPIFFELVFDGQTIKYTYDNSLDAFGSNQKRPTTNCKGIGTESNDQGREYYVLTDCDNDTGDTFWFAKE